MRSIIHVYCIIKLCFIIFIYLVFIYWFSLWCGWVISNSLFSHTVFCVLFNRWVLVRSGRSLAPRQQLQRLVPSARSPSVSGTSARSGPPQWPAGLEPGAGGVQRAPGRDPWGAQTLVTRAVPPDRPAQTLQHHRSQTTAHLRTYSQRVCSSLKLSSVRMFENDIVNIDFNFTVL